MLSLLFAFYVGISFSSHAGTFSAFSFPPKFDLGSVFLYDQLELVALCKYVAAFASAPTTCPCCQSASTTGLQLYSGESHYRQKEFSCSTQRTLLRVLAISSGWKAVYGSQTLLAQNLLILLVFTA